MFIGFTDEERGEIGSRFYAQHMTKEEVAATEAMVNMDTLGLGPTAIWASHADRQLNFAIATVASQLQIPVTGVNVEQVGSTDSEPFAARKIPRITIHTLTQQTWDEHILHTTKDKISAINMDDYYQTYRLVSAYLAFLDATPSRTPADVQKSGTIAGIDHEGGEHDGTVASVRTAKDPTQPGGAGL